MAKKYAILGSLAVLAAFVVPVIVTAGGVLPLSRNSVSVGVGNNVTITSYAPNGQRPNVTSNTNAFVAYANVSGSSIIIYGLESGFSQLTFCTYDNYCGTVNVTVGSGGGNDDDDNDNGSPEFTNSNLPQMYVNQYFSYQFSVRDGTRPYDFEVRSGSLPRGINLTDDGLLYGTPTRNTETDFTIRVTDARGRTDTTQRYFVQPQGNVSGSILYNNGTLINDNGTIYITYKNTKSGFANMSAFNGLGYKTSNIVYNTTSGIDNSGFVVSSQYMAHPWGSWVKSGNTVYFVHDDGLIPIGSYSVFLNNGGVDSNVVPVNGYDLNKPVLSIMRSNDSRLR